MSGIDALTAWVQRVGTRKFRTNEWLYADDMKVYVRKGVHACGVCLDIATVEVYDRGRGTFTRFLEAAQRMNPWDATFCECVHDERLCRFLERQGYTIIGEIGFAPNYYLLKGSK